MAIEERVKTFQASPARRGLYGIGFAWAEAARLPSLHRSAMSPAERCEHRSLRFSRLWRWRCVARDSSLHFLGPVSSLVVIILTGHDARVAKPFGENDDERAGRETKDRPECGKVFGSGMRMLLIDKQAIGDNQEREQDETNPHHRGQPVPQILDEFDQFHEMTCCRKRRKNPGYSPMTTEITAVTVSGTTKLGCASLKLCWRS